ncbi:hypothetical protein Acr_00g0015820 [Actinidia rufa]|uniref:DC1 domain-containing protein n=1 Tax=Actinidia rufa TaxID=165716 RepID=A0A7J0DC38_9ERIC|nr:hypothetical protein Acr_00g0015820 [Actinidia rufa]
MEMKPVFIEIATDLWPAPPVCYVTLSVIITTSTVAATVLCNQPTNNRTFIAVAVYVPTIWRLMVAMYTAVMSVLFAWMLNALSCLLPIAKVLIANRVNFTPIPLILCDKNKNFCYKCSCCKLPIEIQGGSLYACLQCRALLHKSCAHLPQKMEHPLHPSHPLVLLYGCDLFTCQVCSGTIQGFWYYCSECKFYMDVRCAALKPTENNKCYKLFADLPQVIDHLLHPRTHSQLPLCAAIPRSFVAFVAIFNLHVHCVSILPRTLKSNNHVHPLTLTLTDSPIKDHADEDDNAEFYCGACEELRVLADPSYYCEECTYVAHSHCIVSKNISILEEECSKGASDTSGSECLQEECSGQESNVSGTEEEECSGQDSNASESEYVEEPPSLTLKEFLDSFDRIEKNHVESLSQYYDVIKHYCRSGFSRLDKIIELTIRNYELANQIEVPWQDWDESTLKVVPVGEYMIPDHWAPILRALIAKYGEHRLQLQMDFKDERFNLSKAYEIRELEMKLETKRELLSLGQDCCLDAVKLKGQTAVIDCRSLWLWVCGAGLSS